MKDRVLIIDDYHLFHKIENRQAILESCKGAIGLTATIGGRFGLDKIKREIEISKKVQVITSGKVMRAKLCKTNWVPVMGTRARRAEDNLGVQ